MDTKIIQRRKAAGLEELLPAVVTFVLIALVGAVGVLILQNFSNTGLGNTCTGTNTINPTTGLCTAGTTYLSPAYNGIVYGISGVNTFMSYLPLIALVIVAAILIGIVLVAFAFGGNKNERF